MADKKSKHEDSYNRLIGAGQYSYSSHAYKLEPEELRRGAESEARRSVRSPKSTAKQRPQAAGQKRARSRVKHSPYAITINKSGKSNLIKVLGFTVVFLGAFLVVFSMAYIESKKLELNAYQNELKQLKTDNIVLKGEILDNCDLVDVELYATAVLGMAKPNESQIVYVDEVKVSYIEQYETVASNVSASQIFSNIISSVKGLVHTDSKTADDK